MRSRPLMTHPEGEFTPLSEWSTRDSNAWLSRRGSRGHGKRWRYKRLGCPVTRYMSLVPLLCIPLYILLCNVEWWGTILFHTYIIPSTSIVSYIFLLVITRSTIRMSVGTSDSTVISSITTEAHNPNTTNASAAPRDGSSPATIHTTTPQKPSWSSPRQPTSVVSRRPFR